MKGITREQRSEILRLVGIAIRANCDPSFLGGSQLPSEELINYLDSLVAEPAEQPYGPLSSVAEVQAEEDARLHADDARAAMAALLTVPREYSITSDIELAKKAHEIADAFKAERKRRQT